MYIKYKIDNSIDILNIRIAINILAGTIIMCKGTGTGTSTQYNALFLSHSFCSLFIYALYFDSHIMHVQIYFVISESKIFATIIRGKGLKFMEQQEE